MRKFLIYSGVDAVHELEQPFSPCRVPLLLCLQEQGDLPQPLGSDSCSQADVPDKAVSGTPLVPISPLLEGVTPLQAWLNLLGFPVTWEGRAHSKGTQQGDHRPPEPHGMAF